VSPDGICGPVTIAAIKQWQSQNNLTPDGIVGPRTAQAMGLQTTTKSGTPPGATGDCNGDPNLVFSNGICLPKSSLFPTTGIAGSTTLSGLLLSIIKLLLTFAGIVAVVMLVLGGYWYMAAGGNEEMSEKGKKTIINFVLGLVVVLLAYTIVTVISDTLTSNTLIPTSQQPK